MVNVLSDFFGFLQYIPVLLKSRVEAIFLWSWCIATSSLIAGGGFPPLTPTILIIFSMIFVVSSVYLYNDVQDKDMDGFNKIKKDRPLPSETVPDKEAMKIIYLFGIIGLAIAYYVNITSFLLVSTYYVLYYLYSYPRVRLKMRYLGKEFVLFMGWPICSQIASYAVTNTYSLFTLYVTIMVGFYVITVGPIFGDAVDYQEDKDFGVKSFSTLLGWPRKVQLMLLGVFFNVTMTYFMYFQFKFSILIPVTVTAGSLLFTYLVYPLIKVYNNTQIDKAKKIAEVYMISFQLFLVFSSL